MKRMTFLPIALCGLAAMTGVRAASSPPALAAAYMVAANNADFQPENCGQAKDNPKRPDRVRLARLVARMKDPNARFDFGTGHANPLVLAVLADDVALLHKLIARGGTFDSPELKNRAMYIAAESDGPAMIEALVKHGLTPDSHAKGGFTPLMIAAWNDRLESVQTLLRLGADPTIRASSGNTALAGAVYCRNPAMVRALIGHGARPDGYIKQIEKRKGTHLIADARAASGKPAQTD